MRTNRGPYTRAQLRQMVGCRASYQGEEVVIVSFNTAMQMIQVRRLSTGSTAILKPAELR